MANRFYSPNQQFEGNGGVPYAGGFLYFYATGTSTPLSTYSDAALTIANTNPIILDSNGQAGSVFLQNLPYKVVLKDSLSNQIWTEDPVYSSDYSTYASFRAWGGNPNGQVAGTAGTQGVLPGASVIWDYVNNILYVATTTGSTTTTVWTAVNSTSSTVVVPPPQGYLTLNSDPLSPVVVGDTTSTTVFYAPYNGNAIPIYNGSAFALNSFVQLTLTLVASHAASTLYDVFVFNNSGVLTMVTGPAWTSSTVGSCVRGTGGSTTQLQRLNGLFVNAVQISGRNGSNLYTIGANTATYVGTLFIDSTPGQVTCHTSWGQNRKWGVWNTYNRLPIYLKGGDATASWAYSVLTTVRQSNGAAGNNIMVLQGLPEEYYTLEFTQKLSGASGLASTTPTIGLGWNSTTVVSGTSASLVASVIPGPNATTNTASVSARHFQTPSLGLNQVNSLEYNTTANTSTFSGTEQFMMFSAQWRG